MRVLLLLTLLFVFGCGEESTEEPKKIYVTCSVEDSKNNRCTRYMDRDIHLAYSLNGEPNKNNAFQKQEIINAFKDIEESTPLGAGYFRFSEVDPILIEPVFEPAVAEKFRSFIQVVPTEEFNELAGQFGSIPDSNSIVVINAANKRQFYIIFRAECFEPNNILCTNDEDAIMGSNGVKAMVARALSFLVGVSINCSTNERIMCPDFPSDLQYVSTEKMFWSASFANALSVIDNTPGFYENFEL